MKTTVSTTDLPSIDELLKGMSDIAAKYRNTPTAFVMTHYVAQKLRKTVAPQIKSSLFGRIDGLTIESFATARECLDRMMRQQSRERLQLVISMDWEPVLDHEWFVEWVNSRDGKWLLPIWISDGLRSNWPRAEMG